jgi:ubiquinol-cytochrome c reductase cytochrome b subunit
MPGRIVRRATYIQEYNRLAHEDGIPFVPGAFWKDVAFSFAMIAAVGVCAFVFGPQGPTGMPDPSIIQTVPKPDFAFLWIYTTLAFLPPQMETVFILAAPLLAIAVLIALPFVAGEGEKSWHRRPIAVLTVSFIAICWAVLTDLGTYTPWSPHMDAWSQDAVAAHYMHNDTPLQRAGAVVFQDKQCRNCHSVGGAGGQRGPALDNVATRLTADELREKVVTGGGNMPAYGKNLSPPEVEALVSFLETLHPVGQKPAVDIVQQEIQQTSVQSK